jgi:hypothetical protein
MGIQFENLGPKESIQLQEFLLPLILRAMDEKPENPRGS